MVLVGLVCMYYSRVPESYFHLMHIFTITVNSYKYFSHLCMPECQPHTGHVCTNAMTTTVHQTYCFPSYTIHYIQFASRHMFFISVCLTHMFYLCALTSTACTMVMHQSTKCVLWSPLCTRHNCFCFTVFRYACFSMSVLDYVRV